MVNTLKTTLLLGLLTGLFLALGSWLGGESGMVLAFLLAMAMNVVAYWFSDRVVLRLYGARPLGEPEAPAVHEILRRLATRAGIPMPRLYLIPASAPNAFATGRSPRHAAVAVTEGLLRLMDLEELEGVLGHELAHVLNRDTLISTLAATLAGAIMLLVDWARWAMVFGAHRDEEQSPHPLALVLMVVVAPLAALLIQMAVSRAREYQADATGARLTRRPLALASALAKLHQASRVLPLDASPATAHLFIVNPLSGRSLLTLFSTHPPIEDRIARLRKLRLA